MYQYLHYHYYYSLLYYFILCNGMTNWELLYALSTEINSSSSSSSLTIIVVVVVVEVGKCSSVVVLHHKKKYHLYKITRNTALPHTILKYPAVLPCDTLKTIRWRHLQLSTLTESSLQPIGLTHSISISHQSQCFNH